MEDKKNNEQMNLLAGMLGNEGADALGMIKRMERLQRLFKSKEEESGKEKGQTEVSSGPIDPFGSTQSESVIFAAIPFLDREYQRDIYMVVRLMEMNRVLGSGRLEAREKQEEPGMRRHQLLRAVRPFLAKEERNSLDTMLRVMQMREIMETKEGR